MCTQINERSLKFGHCCTRMEFRDLSSILGPIFLDSKSRLLKQDSLRYFKIESIKVQLPEDDKSKPVLIRCSSSAKIVLQMS